MYKSVKIRQQMQWKSLNSWIFVKKFNNYYLFIYLFICLVFFIFCVPYFYGECYIRNTSNCHLTVLSLLAAWGLNYSKAGNLLIRSLLIRSFAHCSFAHSPFRSNQLWAIHSDHSRQMSDRERIAQVAQRKWATVSESLRSLKTNERPWAIRSGRSEEMSDLLKTI